MSSIDPKLEQEALRVIGNLDFEKAFKIIYNGTIPSDADREEESKKIGQPRTHKLAYKFTEDSEPTEFEPSNIVDSKERVIQERDAIIKAYELRYTSHEEKTSDHDFNRSLDKQTVYKNIINHEQHYDTLKQYPIDWRNLDLFAQLWAYGILIRNWDRKNFTHRENQLAHEYKVQAGYEKLLTATELRGISEKRYQASLTLNRKNSNYREATKAELKNAILYLQGYPDAIDLAENDLKKLI